MKDVISRVQSALEAIWENTLFVGIASLIWLLYRSGTKPSRLRYPCQRSCMVNVSLYLSPAIVPLASRLIHTRERLSAKVILRAVAVVALFFGGFLLVEAIVERLDALYTPPVDVAMFQHGPMGVQLDAEDAAGQPVYATSPQAQEQPAPNRVVSVHDSRATNWDYQTDYYWEYVEQGAVDNMVAQGVMALTGETNLQDAWAALIPYQPGDDVAIKVNANNSYGCTEEDNGIDPLPETINAVIHGLKLIGVPEDSIWVFDATHSRVLPNRFINGIDYPGVRYFSFSPWHTCNEHTTYVDPSSPEVSGFTCTQGNLSDDVILPPQVLVDAEHLINVPIFKSHGNYPTLALKNHYGTVFYDLNDRSSMHTYFEAGGGGGCNLDTENVLADINNNPNIRDKTRLVIGDGLFGNPLSNWQSVERWRIFGDDDPNILFFSGDPVAISSVMLDYIVEERGNQNHGMLHAAALLGLGLHEHWDSFETKHYDTIDYVIIDFDTVQLTLQGEPADQAIRLTWEVGGELPPTATWRIDYDGPAGTPPSPITGIISPTRAYTLTDLTNYAWYNITLSAMLDSTPWLSDTVRVMPPGYLVHLPLVSKGYW